MRYQIDEKTTKMNYISIYLPSNLFGIFMQNYKMFIGTRDAKHASGKY